MSNAPDEWPRPLKNVFDDKGILQGKFDIYMLDDF